MKPVRRVRVPCSLWSIPMLGVAFTAVAACSGGPVSGDGEIGTTTGDLVPVPRCYDDESDVCDGGPDADRPCTNNGDCPSGQTCEDYDCDGVRHCSEPHNGGPGNCCTAVSGASCSSGMQCCWGSSPSPGEGRCWPSNGSCPGPDAGKTGACRSNLDCGNVSGSTQNGASGINIPNACFGACGSGCDYCQTITTDAPTCCGDHCSVSTDVQVICPYAYCCVQHDTCMRGCPEFCSVYKNVVDRLRCEAKCEAECQAEAVRNGCSGGLVGAPDVPDVQQVLYYEQKCDGCTGQCTTYINPITE
jgi:hypothetical protein